MASHKYAPVGGKPKFIIEDDEDDAVEISLQSDSSPSLPNSSSSSFQNVVDGTGIINPKNDSAAFVQSMWNMLTFAWVKPLLELGNSRALEQTDLYDLDREDSAVGVYETFSKKWKSELKTSKPSVAMAYMLAYGGPFVAAGFLKLIHDSCIFISPMMLKHLISFLSDPNQPTSVGIGYVLIIFCANVMMSMCLRQYFYWCYLTGMRLRSAVITSVYNKSLVLGAAALSSRSSGEIMNLMSVDASRMQELTPYLHAIWYSFYQITVAVYFLWQQVSYAALSGIAVILILIPVTAKVSMYLKATQKEISKIRDERVKVTNEVLAGMKVIKFQAWELEFEGRIQAIRTKELEYLKKYMMMQSYSSALYTSIPLLVAIATFSTYVLIMKEPLTIATALTSLALFDILRFPLAMLPNVLNNVIEARISLDRIQSFLLEADAEDVPNEFSATMKKNMSSNGSNFNANANSKGVYINRASFMNEKTYTAPKPKSESLINTYSYDENTTLWTKLHDFSINLLIKIKRKVKRAFRNNYGSPHSRSSAIHHSGVITGPDRMFELGAGFEEELYDTGDDDEWSDEDDDFAPREYSYKSYVTTQHLLLDEAEKVISTLEKNLYKAQYGQTLESNNSTSTSARSDNGNSMWEAEESLHDHSILHMLGEEDSNVINTVVSPLANVQDAQVEGGSRDNLITLALSRINIQCSPGEVVAIVGQVGCGKTSILRALLGDMKLLYGDAVMKGSCAYVSQKPFIQNATVQDNILFGLEYDEERYMKALSISALLPDMEVLPAGDMTEIGERGINLSGGQKTRVAIARAVYNDADIYLLDDPLAAVDAHVGQHLYSKCIQKLADEGKTVVFITNGLQYTKTCNRIYVLKDGRIAESGTYNELMQLGQRVQQQGHISDSGAGLFYDMINAFMEQGGGEEDTDINTDMLALQTDVVTRDRVDSVNPVANAKAIMSNLEKKRGKLTSKEDRETGDVNLSVYRAYLDTFGGVHIVGYVLLVYLSVEFIGVLASWWLSYWSEHSTEDPKFYLYIYILINVAVSCASLAREIQMRMKCLGASTKLYDDLLKTILYAPMAFFDTTPLGRIVNRFTKDIYTLDESLPATIRMYIGSLTRVGGVLIYISVVTPFFMIVLIPIALFYRMCQNYYISTSRELSRLESVSRSPIYALFSETIDGMSTIRAYGAQRRFCQRNNKLLDDNQRAYYLRFSSNCWLAVRLEMAGTMIVSLAALTAVLTKAHLRGESGVTEGDYSVFAGMAGLSISLSLSITQSLNWSVRMASDMESQMVSVERVTNYTTQISPEADYTKTSDPGGGRGGGESGYHIDVSVTGDDESDELGSGASHMPLNDDHGLELPGVWPSKGVVEFRSVCLRYRPGLPLVLNNCSFMIGSQEKIGVVGRTGAGKSSLVTALLRLVELEEYSHIYIDDVDISSLGLKALRSKITVIPQDPVLFSGTIRNNLDPFNQYTDEQIWQSVKRLSSSVETQFVSSLLDTVEENGSNYSVGQRQLLCIARALLTRAKIIVMDEATAAIDIETDALIQKAIRTDFVHATCLTIAHRLNTIMDCDKVLVMDNGRAAEYDSPKNLLSNSETMFSKLVENWEHANK